jgi:hypothetical protein
MALLTPWLLFPAVIGLLSLGSGLLLERLSATRLPGALRLPAGLALVIVVGLFTTMAGPTASLTAPLTVGLATAGFLLSTDRRPRARNWSLAALFLFSFGAYAAPVLLSGQATFSGYLKLDDTASFLGFTDQIMAHGRDLSGLVPSTYAELLRLNIAEGYPVGTFLPLGIGARLIGQDPAWVYQPCIALYAAMAALVLYALLEGVVASRALRAATAFLASQAALLYAYALWGGIKEVAAAAMLALVASLGPLARDDLRRPRALVPFAVAAAATLGVLSATGMIWVGPLALPAVIALRSRSRGAVRSALFTVGATAALAIPSIVIAPEFLRYTSSNLLTESQRLGNLVSPLRFIQILGIWPIGDFRFTPSDYEGTRVLILVCGVAALGGGVYAVRRRAFRLPLVALVCIAASLLLDVASSPWLTGKALASGSPFVVSLGLVGAAALIQSGRAVEGTVVAIVIGGGVLWSNVLGYRAVWLAPRSQLVELQQIGARFSGAGPTLMTEYQPYGVRHFLRGMDAEGASELRVRPVPLANGTLLGKGAYADLDEFRYPDILVYRTFVLRRSPVESRPAAPYRLVWQGRFYDVWERPASGGGSVIEHIPLGSSSGASAVPSCGVVLRAAALAARDGAMLAAARTPDPAFASLGDGAHPSGWLVDAADGELITPNGSGTLQTSVLLPSDGTYAVWLDGLFLRRVSVSVDGRRVGSIDESGGLYVELGTARLRAGRHQVTLSYGDPFWAPGSSAPGSLLGPLAFSPAGAASSVQYLAPGRARSLCGQRLDWLEVVSA